jgi:hypothetical protein
MPKPVVCPTCATKIPYGTINQDILDGFPRLGTPHPGQRTIMCACCGAFMHADCASLISWQHLWFSNLRMREIIEKGNLVGMEIALCSACADRLGREIVGTYRALQRFDEGARFLEEFGRAAEDAGSSRMPKRTRVLEGTSRNSRHESPRGTG